MDQFTDEDLDFIEKDMAEVEIQHVDIDGKEVKGDLAGVVFVDTDDEGWVD